MSNILQVLKELKYIDEHNAVQLKGRVACEISSHELMITELVFKNELTELHPTEIAALMSSMVFEQKKASEPKLIDTLEKVGNKIQYYYIRISCGYKFLLLKNQRCDKYVLIHIMLQI